MGLLSGIKSLFGGSEDIGKIAEKAADGIYNGIDKLVYTEEERADALAKGREVFLEFTKIAYDQNQIRAVTRRWLAFIVIGPAMMCFISSGIAYAFSEPLAKHLFGMFQEIGPWAIGILAFYYGPHLLGSIRK